VDFHFRDARRSEVQLLAVVGGYQNGRIRRKTRDDVDRGRPARAVAPATTGGQQPRERNDAETAGKR